MNSLAEIKSSLHLYIAETDDVKILSKINNYVKGLIDQEGGVVAYSSKGEPLTHEGYKDDIDKIIEVSRDNDVVSQEEMEKDL